MEPFSWISIFEYQLQNHGFKAFAHLCLLISQNSVKIIAFVFFYFGLSAEASAWNNREQVIFPDQSLMNQVNAETPGNQIPWFQSQEKYDVRLEARFSSERQQIKKISGAYSYTLYRFTYSPEKLVKGEFLHKELTFFIERKFPAPGSEIKYKELWPFNKDNSLIFKLLKGKERFVIVSIEK